MMNYRNSAGLNFLLQRLVDPEIEPVTLAEAKRHIKQFANVTSEDADITEWIKLAREWVEDYTGRAMVDQTWRLSVSRDQLPVSVNTVDYDYSRGLLMCPPSQSVYLRRSPVLAITKLATVDRTTNIETVLDPSEYILWDEGTRWPRVVPATGATWGASDFRVEYRAGFADRTGSPITGAEVVPSALKHAIKLILGNYDANRELVNIGNIVNELPLGLSWLLGSEKCDLGMA